MFNTAADKEWEAWRVLCTILEESGAVTKADLTSSVQALDTKGQRLLEAIRIWGDRHAILVSQHPDTLADIEERRRFTEKQESEAFLFAYKRGEPRKHGYAAPEYPKDGRCTICGKRRDDNIHD